MGLATWLRRLNVVRANGRLLLGDTLSELELLRISFETSHRRLMDEARFRSTLSDLLGLTRPESSTGFDRATIQVSRVAKDEDILAEVRRLKQMEPRTQD